MCGIYGMVSLSAAPLRYPEHLTRMGERLQHRGPDSTGTIIHRHAAIGVNRLQIVDRHKRGDQPFYDTDHCLALAANGEIYNSPELRPGLSYPFRSYSDVETIIPLYLRHGPAAISQLNGMFALAIWDERHRRLVLSRDRAGEKPLFYALVEREIWFASELQALLVHPSICEELDFEAVGDFVELGYVREPRTMFRSIRKVPAGTTMVVELGETHLDHWGRRMETSEVADSLPVLEGELARLLEQAVRRQLVGDVPVGVFLSGGLDSSILALLAQRAGLQTPLRTFSVRFADSSYDEGRFARQVADQVGATHSEVLADSRALASAYHELSGRVAEPIADPAILPTYLLAARAKNDVGVVLSGEGADELFGGYPTYLGHQFASVARQIPRLIRRALAGALPRSSRSVPLSYLLRRLLEDADRPWLQRHVGWFGTGLEIGFEPGTLSKEALPSADVLGDVMRFDYETYLREGLLPKIDRPTMLVALEARSPYLDREVTRFAFSLPSHFKVRGLRTKWLLKRTARRWLPASVIGRRKHGLSVPISSLINGALRSEVDRLFEPKRMSRQGLLNPRRVGQLLSEHRGGNFGVARGVWALVVLQKWLEEWT